MRAAKQASPRGRSIRLPWVLVIPLLGIACARGSDKSDSREWNRPGPQVPAADAGGPVVPDGTCGNGLIETHEQCDQGNLGGRTCQTEGFASGSLQCTDVCTLDTSFCSACGDGVADPGEECDGDDLGPLTSCADLNAGSPHEPLLCNERCLFDFSRCSGCGDGVVTPPEDCEPGTESSKADLAGGSCEMLGWHGGNLGCAPGCRFDESGCYACGDATRNGLEQCDGADFGGLACTDFQSATGSPFTTGTLHCTSDCKIDLSNCSRCGDGVVTGNEVCDAGVLNDESCKTQGFSSGVLACALDCLSYDTSRCTLCGNGEIEGNESCDGANLGGATCESLGYGAGALSCSPGCVYETSACSNQSCGDGVVDGADACDCGDQGLPCTPEQLDFHQCSDFPSPGGSPFSGGTLRCMSPQYCAFDTSGCYYCGDGSVDADEECDGTTLGGASCSSLGFASGSLSCSPNCRFDKSACVLVDNPIFRCAKPSLPLIDGDPDGVSDSFEIPADGQITDVDVVLFVVHGWAGDVTVKLTHGDTTRLLIDRPGVPAKVYGCAGRDIDVTLDDEGMGPAEDVCWATPPALSGALVPEESLSAFDGQSMSGTWSLQVADVAADYTGTLVEWCVVVSWQ